MRISFVMLGTRDHRTGGYEFNGKVADALEKRGHRVDRVHFATVPARARTGKLPGSIHVARRVAAGRPDVVMVSRSYGVMAPLRAMLSLWKVPVLYLVHHLEWMDTPQRPRRLYRAAVRWMVSRGDLVWCNSLATARGLELLGIEAGRIRTIPPGFDRFPVERAEPRPGGRKVILCAGALTERKNQKLVLRACALLGRNDYELVLAGSHQEEPRYAGEILRAASSPELCGLVTVPGHQEKEAVHRLMCRADLLVNGAPWEAYGIAVAEAMWAGLPVVASRSGAVPEMVTHGLEGLLYEPGDAEGMAGHLSSLLDHHHMRTMMGSAARSRAEKLYTWERTCEEFANLVEETACRQVRRNMPCGPGVPKKDC